MNNQRTKFAGVHTDYPSGTILEDDLEFTFNRLRTMVVDEVDVLKFVFHLLLGQHLKFLDFNSLLPTSYLISPPRPPRDGRVSILRFCLFRFV